MKTLIFYKSNTGFTKQYVDMLSRRIVDSDVYDIKYIRKRILKDANIIFFGGPIRNNKILGLNKFLKEYDTMEGKEIFIFAVGIQPVTSEVRDSVIIANGLNLYHVRLYFLQGGMDLSRMKPLKRKLLLYGISKAANSKEGKAQGVSAEMIKSRLASPVDFVKNENLDKMVNVYHQIILKK